jgi:hypothetical protein
VVLLKYTEKIMARSPKQKNGLEAMIERDKSSSTDLIFVDGWKQPLLPVMSGSSIVGAYSVGGG